METDSLKDTNGTLPITGAPAGMPSEFTCAHHHLQGYHGKDHPTCWIPRTAVDAEMLENYNKPRSTVVSERKL